MAFVHLCNLHLGVHLLLLELVLKLLLTLLSRVKRDFLLKCIVLNLLVLEEEVLDLTVELLED